MKRLFSSFSFQGICSTIASSSICLDEKIKNVLGNRIHYWLSDTKKIGGYSRRRIRVLVSCLLIFIGIDRKIWTG